MRAKFCLPIIKSNTKEVTEIISRNKKTFSMLEVWIDYIIDPFDVILKLLRDQSNDLGDRLIVVFRRRNGEKIIMNPIQRKKILNLLLHSRSFIDLDIQSQKEELDFLRKNKHTCGVITSFHDYKKTPRTNNLTKIINEMEIFNPTIYKIAAHCQTEKQAVALLHMLLDLKEQQKKVVILGMGKKGTITRIFGSLWGNEIIFAPENVAEASAPGQLTREQLMKIFSIIEK